MSCAACGRGFHKECETKCKRCHPKKKTVILTGKTSSTEEYKKRGKTAEGLKDAASTGRKRAAELYPLNRDAPCEWRGKRNCGGGRNPVVGCVDGKQQDRHHGPVKNTVRNQSGNVHRICKMCHNHWHERNDLEYDEREYGLLPHDPDDATPEELVNNHMEWITGAMGKKYTLASSVNKGLKLDNSVAR